MVRHLVSDGPEQQTLEAAEAPGSDDHKVGTGSAVDEDRAPPPHTVVCTTGAMSPLVSTESTTVASTSTAACSAAVAMRSDVGTYGPPV